MCDENYYGNPEVSGGSCQQCNCNNNVDRANLGNCDPHSGKCLKCLFNTEGENCEVCITGFFGDAIQQMCRGKYFQFYLLVRKLGLYIEKQITFKSTYIFSFHLQNACVTFWVQNLLHATIPLDNVLAYLMLLG